MAFPESGAYFRAVLTLKVMSSEVVLTIELVLTFERSYNRARTVVIGKDLSSFDAVISPFL